MSSASNPMALLIERYRERRIRIALDAGRLAIRAQKGALSADDKRELASYREQLVAYLSGPELEDSFPLTEIQTAYWIGRQSSNLGGVGCYAYREFALDNISVQGLEAAWNRLIQHHEMLRAVISVDGRQRIQRSVPHYRIAEEDFGSGESAQSQRMALREAMSHRMFDPAQWPLFELRVTRVGDTCHLHMGLDLLIADAASILLIYRQWHHYYAHPDQDLPVPTRRFADFVREDVADALSLASAEAYWSPRLMDLPGPPQLSHATAPSELGSPRFVRRSVRLEAGAWTALQKRARDAGMTPSTVLLAAYADVLAAWSRSQRFLLTLTLFRAPPEYIGVVGDFTSTVLVEVDARGADFRTRAAQVQASLADALEHDGWSGVRVAREIGRLRGNANNAIPVVFTSALGHGAHEANNNPLTWLGKTVHAITQTPQVWIDHHVIEDGAGLSLSFDMVDGLIPDAQAEALAAAHARFVESLASGDQAWQWPLGAHLSTQDLAERRAANSTTLNLPRQRLERALMDPSSERLALIGNGQRWTYAELRRRASAIAALLVEAGAQPQQLVGICLAKGPLQVAAVLGTLLAGAAYVPIARSAPLLRRDQLLRSNGIHLVLCERLQLTESWPDACRVIAVEESLSVSGEPVTAAGSNVDDLAYVIFTSGSSGAPKGVMIEHGAAFNTIADVIRRFDVGSNDVLFGLSDLGFDLSVFDIFGSLAAGARLVLPELGHERDPQHWAERLRAEGVTVWNSVPALAAMLSEFSDTPFPQLRLILLSGDWIPVNLPQALRRIAPNARIIALGGATEAAIWSNCFDTAELDPTAPSVPYGWPLANQRFHVLNKALEPSPCGVPGDLYIAGAGLARGYLGDAALSAKKFFQHPRSGERLYATGDLGRYLSGGAIEFLGREDAQIKLDGYRVELGEIEATLTSHPDVREAAAFVVQTRSGARRIAAAVVADQRHESDSALRPDMDDSELPDAVSHLAIRSQRLALPALEKAQARLNLPHQPEGPGTRRSHRSFALRAPSIDILGQLLAVMATAPAEDGPQYRYPSAGSAYPVQVWVHIKTSSPELAAGLYAYHPDSHEIGLIDSQAAFPLQAQAAVNQPVAESAAFAIYLVGVLDAIEPLYGSFARDFSLIEAGAMLQLLQEHAHQLGIGLCPIGAFDQNDLIAPLALGERRFLAISLLGGLHAQQTEHAKRPSTNLPGNIAQYIAERLPAYMLPNRIQVLESLPLSANGKVDRKVLAKDFESDEPQTVEVADGEIEQAVASIFSDVLGCNSPARQAAIFDLGGTSLHVVRIHRRLVAQFGDSLDIVDVFRHPNVAGIATHLASTTRDVAGADSGSSRGARRRARQVAVQRGETK